MIPSNSDSTLARGVLYGSTAAPFTYSRYDPAPALAETVEYYWYTAWNLAPGDDVCQGVLTHPSIQIVVDEGVGERTGIFGIVTRRFERRLSGSGHAFGIKIRPGAFRQFLDRPVSALRDASLPIAEVFGGSGTRYERGVRAARVDASPARLADEFISAHLGKLDAGACSAREAVERIERDASILTVDQLAEALSTPKRTLQRQFHEYVGATPKWVIQRFRIHAALERLHDSPETPLSAIAASAGYYDQSHFTNDFRRLIGCSPTRYLGRQT